MKTNFKSQRGNNVQKAVVRSLAVIVSFVLLSLSVTAQGFWKHILTNNSFSEIAMVLVDNSTEELVAENSNSDLYLYNQYLEEATEKNMELESWMTNDSYFSNKFYFEDAIDMPIELEGWMLDETHFNGGNEEGPLSLEGWMLNNKYWNN